MGNLLKDSNVTAFVMRYTNVMSYIGWKELKVNMLGSTPRHTKHHVIGNIGSAELKVNILGRAP
jgi:hypothetical protein